MHIGARTEFRSRYPFGIDFKTDGHGDWFVTQDLSDLGEPTENLPNLNIPEGIIKQLLLFKGFSDRNPIVDYVNREIDQDCPKGIKAGNIYYNQGEPSSLIYVIADGTTGLVGVKLSFRNQKKNE